MLTTNYPTIFSKIYTIIPSKSDGKFGLESTEIVMGVTEKRNNNFTVRIVRISGNNNTNDELIVIDYVAFGI